MQNDEFGDRMKRYEAATKQVLPPRTYAIIRVDGKAFHTYLRGAEKPFDVNFINAMDYAAQKLCETISGTLFAYVQSDEISVITCDTQSLQTQPWFGGVHAKMISVSASTTTAHFNDYIRRYMLTSSPWAARLALFDSRVVMISDLDEVINYLIWRQRDAVRNSITMVAQTKYSHKQLHLINTGQMQEMLFTDHGINWNDFPDGQKRGRIIRREIFDDTIEYTHKITGAVKTTQVTRSRWIVEDAIHFTPANYWFRCYAEGVENEAPALPDGG